jgi:hypothetical protein
MQTVLLFIHLEGMGKVLRNYLDCTIFSVTENMIPWRFKTYG